METRITNQLDQYLDRLTQRFEEILGERYTALSDEQQLAVKDVFAEIVHDMVGMMKKGKDVHQNFVQNIVINAIDPIIGVDRSSKIFFWNKGAEQTFGYTKEEVMGLPIEILLPDESYRDELEEIIRETDESGFVRNHQTLRKTRSGEILVVNLSRTLIRDRDGEVLGAIAILRDMTQMRRFEQQMLQTEKVALAGQLAAGIAHEIGTPLNIISGIAECLLLDRGKDHPEREDLEIVISQTERIARLIRELLVFSRPQPLRVEPLRINDELLRATNLLGGKLKKTGIRLELALSASLPPVMADANQLQQIFLNLIVNACDALADREASGLLKIVSRIESSIPNQGEIIVEFSDNGTGILPSILDTVFEPFVSSKEPGKGTGLGLAVCKRIMEQHRGSIEAFNCAEGGACFRLHFPAEISGD